MQQQEWLIERERILGHIKELEAENAELRKRPGEDVMPIQKLSANQMTDIEAAQFCLVSIQGAPPDVGGHTLYRVACWRQRYGCPCPRVSSYLTSTFLPLWM